MYRNNFLPSRETELDLWFKNFVGKLTQYATILNITAAETAAFQAQSNMYSYTLTQIEWLKKELEKRTAYKNLLSDGDLGQVIGAYPSITVPPAAPPTVSSGFVTAVINMASRIKSMPNYSESIGKDLGIIASKSKYIKKTIDKPVLNISLNAGQPYLKWIKGDRSGANIYVNRGNGKGFVLLYGSSKSFFADETVLPNILTTWIYKIILRKADQEEGQFSDPVSVAVLNNLANSEEKP